MTFSTDTGRVVVIGTGLAGTRLARRLGSAAVLIGEEAHAPYNRVLLAEVLAGSYGADVIALPGHTGTHLRTRAVRIDRAERVVRCEDGSGVPYDTLVLATGSNPVLPPLRGLFAPGAAELPGGVHAFRTMDDCLALSRAVAPGVRAVVVGGGLLGVSAARALALRGAQVVLTQQSERLMERQLDPGPHTWCTSTSPRSAWRCTRSAGYGAWASPTGRSAASSSPTAMSSALI